MTDSSPGNIPAQQGLMPTDDGHQLYWEEFGSPGGIPALHLHGGPGGTLGASGYRNRWDLSRTRLIGFEQRGCGRSLPSAAAADTDIGEFTTQRLIADIETLRVGLGIEKWIINGVSWGSTLALAYAQAHPERVVGMVLFAVTTTSREEVQWITETVGALFPEAWDRFSRFASSRIPAYAAGELRLVEAYAQLLGSTDLELRDAASREWALWEDTHISLGSEKVIRDPRWHDRRFRHSMSRLTTHFWAHNGFCKPPIIENMAGIRNLPAVLIHGRADVSGPSMTAWKLHQLWPASSLVICETDGHGGAEMVDHWTSANANMLDLAS
ncbi:alpha/beta fold hydrolase [Glutamicibacter sp.]|uniref:alpha/beta fold hydrolase n=1 Tax=Glutamicibacter sp. TaxID=1931995 RepID=UPI002FCC53FE